MLKHLRGFMHVIMVTVIVASLLFLYISSRDQSERLQAWQQSAKRARERRKLLDSARTLEEKQILMTDVRYPYHDPDTGRVTAEVTGTTAILDADEQEYLIVNPLIKSKIRKDQLQGAVSGDVTVSAERCILRRGKGEAVLTGDVVVNGDNFRILTNQVTYKLLTRTLHTDSHVKLDWYDEGQGKKDKPAITIEGNGLQGELTAKRVKILSKPVVHIREASGRFFADSSRSGGKENGNGGPPETVTITAVGNLTYDHLTSIATFREQVSVRSGEKRLTCDKLVVQFLSSEEGVSIKQVDAFDDAHLSFGDRRATADHIQWRRVTQTTVLNTRDEEPVRIEQADLALTARRVFFYQMDRRLDVDDAGRLVKLFPPEKGGKQQEPRRLIVSWSEAMSYDAKERRAQFRGGVKMHYDRVSLSAQEVEFTFSREGQTAQDFVARENVLVVMTPAEEGGNQIRATGKTLHWKTAESKAKEQSTRKPADETSPLAKVTGMFTLAGTDSKPARLQHGPHWIKARAITYDQTRSAFIADAAGELNAVVQDDPAQPFPDIVNVTWSKRMTYAAGKKVRADFTGDVKARRKGQNITSDQLAVLFRPTDDKAAEKPEEKGPGADFGRNLAVAVIKADGNVELTQRPFSQVAKPAEAAGAEPRELWLIVTRSLDVYPAETRMVCDAPGFLKFQRADQPENVWLKITWNKEMSFEAEKGRARFKGKTVSTFSDNVLEADELGVKFNEKQVLDEITGGGNVKLARPLARKGKAPLTATVTCKEIKASFGDSESASRYLKQATAEGEVVVDDPEYALMCDRLDLWTVLRKATERSGIDLDIDRAIAVGKKVVIVQKVGDPVRATGDRLVWERQPRQGIDRYTLTGKQVELQRDGVAMTQKKIVVDRINHRVVTEGGGRIDYDPNREPDR